MVEAGDLDWALEAVVLRFRNDFKPESWKPRNSDSTMLEVAASRSQRRARGVIFEQRSTLETAPQDGLARMGAGSAVIWRLRVPRRGSYGRESRRAVEIRS